MDHPQQSQDHNVQLLKNDKLGSGSYGMVCKAMIGQHPCAAKLLHPIFFESHDPGMVTTRQRFEQECHFLNDMKHPHIVEYLGTSHDPDYGLLVLLMELMDESLTHFLERSQQPLAYYIEVDLCHDIAQALAYIHSKEIIHRDLSSNNVLLIAGRAKISDFGMSKLFDANRRMTPLTMCPGNLVYMPPEALRDPPVYSKKIDSFSFGVLQIQIMTRQFPDPGPAMRVVEDSRSPIGTINMPVLDSERRKSHIDLIHPTHTLLPTALGCLNYSEKDRPSAQDLCRQLAAFKEAPRYIESMQLAQLRVRYEEQAQQIHHLRQELHTKDQQLQDSQRRTRTLQQELQTKDQQLQASQRRTHTLEQELQTKDTQLQTKDQQLQDSQRRTCTLQQELQTNETHLQTKDQQLQASKRRTRTQQQKLQTKDQQLQDSQRRTCTLQQELQTKDTQLQTMDQQLQASLRRTRTQQQELQTKDQQLQDGQRHTRTLQQELQTKDQQLQGSQRQIQELTHQVEEKQHMIDDKETLLRELNQSNEQVMAKFQRNLLQHEQANKQLQNTFGQLRQDLQQAMEEKLKMPQVGAQPHETIAPPRPELQQPQEKQHAIEYAQPQLIKRPGLLQQKTVLQHATEYAEPQPMKRPGPLPRATEGEQLQPMKQPGPLPQKTVMEQKAIRDMKWQKEPEAPMTMFRGSAAADSNMAYFNSYRSTTVHSYDSNVQEWHRLPDTPHTYSTLVVVDHILTMVGGVISDAVTDSLLSLMGEERDIKWLPNLPAMPTKRCLTAAVCSGHSLIVAGGEKDRNVISTVEVLDSDTQQWSIASSLIHPFTEATISICGERLYMLGGYDQTRSRTHYVLNCSVPELLQSCQPQPLAGKLRTAPANQSAIWQCAADAPHYRSSCATLCGQLVAVGGLVPVKDTSAITGYNETTDPLLPVKDTSAITGYNETTDSWEAMGDMPTARRRALVAILNGKMMVVGGWVGNPSSNTATDVVEILC